MPRTSLLYWRLQLPAAAVCSFFAPWPAPLQSPCLHAPASPCRMYIDDQGVEAHRTVQRGLADIAAAAMEPLRLSAEPDHQQTGQGGGAERGRIGGTNQQASHPPALLAPTLDRRLWHGRVALQLVAKVGWVGSQHAACSRPNGQVALGARPVSARAACRRQSYVFTPSHSCVDLLAFFPTTHQNPARPAAACSGAPTPAISCRNF